MTERQLEHVVGELGVPGEHRPVRIRADDPALLRALGTVVVCRCPSRRCRAGVRRAEPGEAAVVSKRVTDDSVPSGLVQRYRISPTARTSP